MRPRQPLTTPHEAGDPIRHPQPGIPDPKPFPPWDPPDPNPDPETPRPKPKPA